jgi:IclR family pca regulon transcriptional regulator
MDLPAFRDQALPRLMQVTTQVQDIAIKSGLSG